MILEIECTVFETFEYMLNVKGALFAITKCRTLLSRNADGVICDSGFRVLKPSDWLYTPIDRFELKFSPVCKRLFLITSVVE